MIYLQIVIMEDDMQEKKEFRVDLLNRQPFVDNVLDVMNAFSEKKKSVCFAINGVWGSGKSFVLDQLSEAVEYAQASEDYRYYLFRYNCWEYDYYEEPLVSLITSMIRAIDEETNIFSESIRNDVGVALKKIAVQVMRKGLDVVKEKTGIDVNEIIDTATGISDEANEQIKAKYAFNEQLQLQKALMSLHDEIIKLSEERTVVFFVDELDRCLPEYAIRVLERLHHIFEGITNVQVIFSIDRSQLEQAVKQIYGEATDSRRYLKKFIRFELKLELGVVNDGFDKRFKNYISQFSTAHSPAEVECMADFKVHILDGFDIRHRIALVEKAELIHDLLFSGRQGTAQDLCIELFLVVLDDCLKKSKEDITCARKKYIQSSLIKLPSNICFNELNRILRENTAPDDGGTIYEGYSQKIIYHGNTFYGDVLCAYLTVLEVTEAVGNPEPSELASRVKQIWDKLNILV